MPPKRKLKKKRPVKKTQDGDGIVDTAKAIIKRVKDIWAGPRKTASPSIRKFTAENGTAKITKIIVCRQPVTPAVEKVASWISLGKWDSNKKALQYDKMLHLFMIITLDNGKSFTFEKNHVPEISSATAPGNDTMPVASPNVTWNDMLAGAEKAAGGAEKLWVYDAIKQNCQYFVRAVLRGCGVLTPALEKFIMQDADAVIEGLSWFQKLARKATDLANIADVARNGAGKKKRAEGKEEKKTIVCGCGATLRSMRASHLTTARHLDGLKKKRTPKK